MAECVIWTIHVSDIIEWMEQYDGLPFHAVLTDPPYGLEFMGKEWDKLGAGVEETRDSAGGFLRDGKSGSNPYAAARIRYGGQVNKVQEWHRRWAAGIWEVCLPGAMMLSFGGTRTYHRLTCGVEDAGWEIRDCMSWLYGSGFPKSHDISKAIDRAAGAEREKLGRSPNARNVQWSDGWDRPHKTDPDAACKFITAPATPAAQLWDGYGTALKPAYEPILLCQKPLTPVPFDGIIAETQNLIGGLLCLLLSNASNAKKISKLSPAVQGEVSVSVLMLAAVLRGDELGELSEAMGMCSSPETVSMCLNIARLWSGILGDVLTHGSMYTTSTVNEMTTGLQTLNYLLSMSIPAEVIQAVSRPVGYMSNVSIAKPSSINESENAERQQDTFAAELASLRTSDNGTPARNAANSLQPIIPSAVSVLSRVRQLITTESGEKLKPSYRPIILAMKPLDGTFAHNALEHGVAGLWIDGARVGTTIPIEMGRGGRDARETGIYGRYEGQDAKRFQSKGRWPANLILTHHPDCQRVGVRKVRSSGGTGPTTQSIGGRGTYRGGDNRGFFNYADPDGTEQVEVWDCVPDCPVALLDGQSGTLTSGAKHGTYNGWGEGRDIYGGSKSYVHHCEASTGTASRFFYCAKASPAERNTGLNTIDALQRDLSRHPDQPSMRGGEGNPYNRGARPIRNNHPTVKPIALAKYLATLLLPPPCSAPRRILIPFSGSGSEAIGALLAGWEEIVLIDSDSHYCEIAEARLKFWQPWAGSGLDPSDILSAQAPTRRRKKAEAEAGVTQLTLLEDT